MILSSPATASGRPNRSRHGWPSGWRSEDLPSTRTRRRSPTPVAGSTFSGFNIRRYPNGKLLIKPSTAAIKRIRKRLREVFQTMLGASARELIQTLNPIISGWAAYYRTGGVQRGVLAVGRLRVEARAQVGHTPPAATSRSGGSPTATSAGSTRTGRTDGCSATATAASTSRSSPGPGSSGTAWSPAEGPLTTPPWPTTGPADGASSNPRSASTPSTSSNGSTGAARSAGTTCCTPTTPPPPPRSGTQWFRVTRKAISKHSLKIVGSAEPGTPDRNRIHLVHTRCRRLDPRGGTRASTSASPSAAHAACLSRVRGNLHARF